MDALHLRQLERHCISGMNFATLQQMPPGNPTNDAIRVLLADDHDVMRNGARAVIEGKMKWEVCGEARTGREAVALVERLHPQIVVMDMSMPELNGLEATRQIKRASPETEILIFSGMETEEMVVQVFEAGARSFIRKTDRTDQF